MFLVGKWACSNWFTTILYKCNLHNYSDKDYTDKESVVEEAFEYVVLECAQFSGVDLVEDLHKHESVEDQSVVLGLLSWDV